MAAYWIPSLIDGSGNIRFDIVFTKYTLESQAPQNFQEILVLFRLNEIKRPIWINRVIGLNGLIKNPDDKKYHNV